MKKIDEYTEFLSINKMYNEYIENIKDIDNLIKNNFELLTIKNEYNDLIMKVLVVTAASSFERHLCSFLPDILSQGNIGRYNFIKNQALTRKYHTLFSWDQRNANSFYSLFGDEFKKLMKEKISESAKLKQGETDFLLLGNERNYVAHEGVKFADYKRSPESIYELYNSALYYYSELCNTLRENSGVKI